jgi:[CysO sulfur-carrier protein]-thiocarboxylate-dependent cysteine synthase
MPFQYANEANPRAHYEGTGAEIAEALDRVDVLVAGLGTGGTLMGAGERLRESFPDVVVAAAEPLPGDPVMGLRSLDEGYVPPILDVSKLDRKVLVSNEESVVGVRDLLAKEGLFAGVSAGAVAHVARRLAAELEEGVVVCILADAGWKYLSAPFWEAADVERAMEQNVWW